MNISQADFNTVLFGIRGQGGPAIVTLGDGGSACRYRTESGRKCAAGWLLPDNNPAASPTAVGRVYSVEYFRRRPDIHDIAELQSIHDSSALRGGSDFFSLWEPEMAAFAEVHRLTYATPEAT